MVLNGKSVARDLLVNLQNDVINFREKGGRAPCLAVIWVGNNSASDVYIKNKRKACESVGIDTRLIQLEDSLSQEELHGNIEQLNEDPHVDGILLQLPLPPSLDPQKALAIIDPLKDADGLTPHSMGELLLGKPGVSPCTPRGIMDLLSFYQISVKGADAVVVGRSPIVGKPMALMLLQAGATVTICHRQTENLFSHTQRADIVIAAAGVPHLFKKGAFKKGAVVVDVGIHRGASGLCGDVCFEEVAQDLSAISPVPGGVGPMTVASLVRNTLELAMKRQKTIRDY